MEKNSAPYSIKKYKSRIKFEVAPPVKNLEDLIKIGESLKYYKNIDVTALWRIVPALKELNEMVGMRDLKNTVLLQIMYYLQGMHTKNLDGEYLHTIIYGGPGTGKTTVAKIIAEIYSKLGVLSEKNIFKIAHREDFVAGYLGQTALKTKKLLKSCLGGVLFVDELYSLAPRSNDQDSFSKEAIDLLNAFLSEHKGDFCCIAAGYEDDIQECFFSMNKGLERRFPWIHRIEDYSDVDLHDIFMKIIREINWDVAFCQSELVDIIHNNRELFKNAGGDIEVYVTKCKIVHSRRVFSLSSHHKYVLTKEDLENGIVELRKSKPTKTKEPPPGLYM